MGKNNGLRPHFGYDPVCRLLSNRNTHCLGSDSGTSNGATKERKNENKKNIIYIRKESKKCVQQFVCLLVCHGGFVFSRCYNLPKPDVTFHFSSSAVQLCPFSPLHLFYARIPFKLTTPSPVARSDSAMVTETAWGGATNNFFSSSFSGLPYISPEELTKQTDSSMKSERKKSHAG